MDGVNIRNKQPNHLCSALDIVFSGNSAREDEVLKRLEHEVGKKMKVLNMKLMERKTFSKNIGLEKIQAANYITSCDTYLHLMRGSKSASHSPGEDCKSKGCRIANL